MGLPQVYPFAFIHQGRFVTSRSHESVLAEAEKIDLAIIGPEIPLVAGVVDEFRRRGLRAFGPTAAAAALEGSKAFSKDIMKKYGVPTAAFETFTDLESAKKFLAEHPAPIVVKASGLAAGKGAIVCLTDKEANDAVEEMLGIEIPERTKVIRVIVNELSRMADHCICVAAAAQDLGSTTGFFYLFDSREKTMVIWEKLTGARLTNSYSRIGGLYRDLYNGFEEDVLDVCNTAERNLKDVHACFDRNRIFLDRTTNVGVISPERAISYGWTGPCLRATGVASDLRKDEPYYDYETYDWNVVVGTKGDVYDRLMVRLAEIEESIKIVRQALKRLKGPFST